MDTPFMDTPVMDTPFMDSVIGNDPGDHDENLSNTDLGNDGDD